MRNGWRRLPFAVQGSPEQSQTRRYIMAQEWHFWRGTKKIPHVGHAGTTAGLPFSI